MTRNGRDGTTRRELLQRSGIFAAAALGAAAFGAAPAGAKPKTSTIAGVDLTGTGFPFFPNLDRTMNPAPDLLNRLAQEYGKTTATPAMDDFLFGWAPARLFEDGLAPQGSTPQLNDALWVMHLAGYFGGIWLRLKFRDFGNWPRLGFAPTANSFNALASRLDVAVAAVNGSDADALGYATANLRGPRQIGLVDSYGYNAGYLQQILGGSKPTAVTAPSNVITFTDAGVFDATYGGGELRHLQRWRNMARPAPGGPRTGIDAAIEGSGGPDDLRSIQAAGAARGRLTWQSSFLSITGWDQPSYDTLVDTSVIFVQAIQISGLAALAAVGRGRSDWARQATWGHALLGPYGGSYGVGLFDPTYDTVRIDDALPSFV